MKPVQTPMGPHESEFRAAVASVRNFEVFSEMALGWRNAQGDLIASSNRLRRATRGLRDNHQLGEQTREAALDSFRKMRREINKQRSTYEETADALELAGNAMRRAQRIVAAWDKEGVFYEPGPAPVPLTGSPTEAEQAAYLTSVTEHSNRVTAHRGAISAREEEARQEMRRLERRFTRAEEKIRVAHGLPEPCPDCQSRPCRCDVSGPVACPRCNAVHSGACPTLPPKGCPRCGKDPCQCPRRCPGCGYYQCRCDDRCPKCQRLVCRCTDTPVCVRCGGPRPCDCYVTTCSRCGSKPCQCPSRCWRCGSSPCVCQDSCYRCGGPAPCNCGTRNLDPEPPVPPHPGPDTTQPPPTSVGGDAQGPGGPGPRAGGPGMPGGLGGAPSPGMTSGGNLPSVAPSMAMGPGSSGAPLSARGAGPIGGPSAGAAGAAGRPGGVGGASGRAGGAVAGGARGAGGGQSGRAGARGGAGGRGMTGTGAAGAGRSGGRGRGGRRRDDEPARDDLLADDSDWIDGEESGPGVLR